MLGFALICVFLCCLAKLFVTMHDDNFLAELLWNGLYTGPQAVR